jgi:hypothetical protein
MSCASAFHQASAAALDQSRQKAKGRRYSRRTWGHCNWGVQRTAAHLCEPVGPSGVIPGRAIRRSPT